MDQQVKEKIEKEISNNEVCLFMKGTPEVPECGFSMAVVNILKLLEVNYKGVNVNGLELIGLGLFGIWLSYVVFKEQIVI